MSQGKTAVCLISGGLDSAVAAAVAQAEGYGLFFIFADYGQKTYEKEYECVTKLATFFAVQETRRVHLDWLREIGGSALTKSGAILTPDNEQLEYVPFRNTIILSAAVAWAEVTGSEAVFIGSTGGPWLTPDNSPEYIEAFQEVATIGTKLKRDIVIRAPFCRSTKSDVVSRGVELSVPFSFTWTCHNFGDAACGMCSNCRDRIGAFESLGLHDPIIYRFNSSHVRQHDKEDELNG